MYFIHTITLIILLFILFLLWKEEKRFQRSITYGLARKFWSLKEKREYIRFDDEIKIRYRILDKSPKFLSTKTANISQKGLCLLTYEKLIKKGYLDLELEVPGFSKPIKTVGEIVWTKDLKNKNAEGKRLFYVGIKLSKIDPEYEAILLTHLNRLKEVQ